MVQKSILYLIISCSMVLLTCDTAKVSAQTVTIMKNEDPVLVGGDRDKHGCIGSAGYTWSNIKNKCVRLFEVGIRLNPSKLEPNQAVISSFVLFNKNQSKAELFIPDKTPIILNRKVAKDVSIWVNKNFKLFPKKENNGYFLQDGDKTIYSTSEEKPHSTE